MKKMDNKASPINKIKYLIKHPWPAKYWFKELGLGIKSVFRKNSAKMIILLCTAMLGIMFIISIFFYNLGKFVVTVDSSLEEEGFALSDDITFKEEKFRLFGSAIKNCNNININSLPLNLDEDYEGEHNGKNYIAYTFYIKNEGKKNISYRYSINIGKKTLGIEEACWVMVYQNGEPKIYALQRDNGTPERQYSYYDFDAETKFESVKNQVKVLNEDNRGYLDNTEQERIGIKTVEGLRELTAIPFMNSSTVLSEIRENIQPGESDKYTVIVWLEGEDPQCVDKIKGGELELSMNFEKEATVEEAGNYSES